MEMEVEEDNNNSEGVKGGIESEGDAKTQKSDDNDDNNNNLVAEEKDNPLEEPSNELETQFSGTGSCPW